MLEGVSSGTRQLHPMSYSTMPSVGFSIQSSAEEHPKEVMAQSQMIDVMFETSEHTRSSRPDKSYDQLQHSNVPLTQTSSYYSESTLQRNQ